MYYSYDKEVLKIKPSKLKIKGLEATLSYLRAHSLISAHPNLGPLLEEIRYLYDFLNLFKELKKSSFFGTKYIIKCCMLLHIGRTGTAVAAWLLYSGQFKSADVSTAFSMLHAEIV